MKLFSGSVFIIAVIGFISAGCNQRTLDNSQLVDELVLIDDLESEMLISWNDQISDLHYFGYNNDDILVLQENKNDALIWVNHSDINSFLITGYHGTAGMARHRNQIKKEMYYTGASLIRIEREGDTWIAPKSNENRRITGASQMGFGWDEPIFGRNHAFGLVGNESSKQTKWGTIITGESNHSRFYGQYDYSQDKYLPSEYQWESFFNNHFTHYGYVVEVDPATGMGNKIVNMGRFNHTGLAINYSNDGRAVVYSTDGYDEGCLYKYVCKENGKLYPGDLYVADLRSGSWNLISYEMPLINEKFDSEKEMYLRCREAAAIIGGTKLQNPRDIELDEKTGNLYVAINGTNESLGEIVIINEGGNSENRRFSVANYLTGGLEAGFCRPANLTLDAKGNLWFTSSIKPEKIGIGQFKDFGSNGLFVSINQAEAKEILKVAAAPFEAQFTAPCFINNGKNVLIGVNHPGALSIPKKITSKWPGKVGSIPKSSIVVLSGDFLEDINEIPQI